MRDPNDDFDAIVAGLTLELSDDDAAEVRPVTELADGQLMLEFSQVKRELLAAGDMMSNSPAERTNELLSRRVALIVEMHRRGIS